MYIGTSGLQAESTALGVVGDNISNASTIGYKDNRALFADMLGGQLNGQEIGGGVKIAGTQTLFGQGTLEQTGNPLDMAIQGNGFFVVNGEHDGVSSNYYTRDGQFQLDSSGNIVDSQGLKLQGYGVDGQGNRSGSLGNLAIGSMTSPAVPTGTAGLDIQFNSSTPTNGKTFDPANPNSTNDYQTSETVYDSLGNSHQVDVYFNKTADNQWTWHAMTDGGQLTGGTPGTATQLGTGTISMNSDGTFASETSGAASVSFAGGAAPNQAVTFDFTGSSQTDVAQSSQISANNDGHPGGTLTDFKVDPDGKITGTFDNGQQLVVAQLATATFQNTDGLVRQGDNLYAQGASSGPASIDIPGAGGRGSVQQGALEQSNVDLSTELVTMIQYQRAFEANSKTITTADQMTQTITNMR
jgi:flagellar hook protein FlgE